MNSKMGKIYNGIVIFGEMGSGKDELAEQISKLRNSVEKYNIGRLCRDIMRVTKVNSKWQGKERQLGQEIANKLREIDINIMNDYIYACMSKKDNSIVTECTSTVKNSQLSIVVGGRTFCDLEYWKEKGYLIIGISTNDKTRVNRLVCRDGESAKNSVIFQHNTETEARKIVDKLCDETIINDGTLDDLRVEAERILNKYNF
ncbi:MAG: hypothetical protein F8N39_10185 [Clostridiaceae bacterium]|nr:hypothetical protein [Clostridiaceae bacterium]